MADTNPLTPDKLAQVDYWLNKLFFDLQNSPERAAQWRADRSTILNDYPLGPEVRAAVMADDIAVLAPRTNAYLLRFYLALSGMSDAEAIWRLRMLAPQREKADG
jgi:hypothetical protein